MEMVISRGRIVNAFIDFCRNNRFFNAGTNSQYNKAFDVAYDCVSKSIECGGFTNVEDRLTDVVWICSYDENTGDELDRNAIAEPIHEWFVQMLGENEELVKQNRDNSRM